MARGRKPTPTALKVLGGAQPCRVNRDAPAPAAARPAVPDHLDGQALAEWHRIAPLLERMGVLSEVDGAALAIYCVTHARWLEARQSVKEDGLFVDTRYTPRTVTDDQGVARVVEDFNPRGCVKPNPAAAVASACEAAMARLLAEFGLTPASRSRVKATAPAEKDAFAEFLSKAKRNA